MAQDADGTHKGRRSAAGPHSDRNGKPQSGNTGGQVAKEANTKPVMQRGDTQAPSGEGRGASDHARQGQSAQAGADMPNGQQPGRKSRRSRSRRRKGNGPSNQETRVSNASQAMEGAVRGSDGGAAANANGVSESNHVGSTQSQQGSNSHSGDNPNQSRGERSRNRSRKKNRSSRNSHPLQPNAEVTSEARSNAQRSETRTDAQKPRTPKQQQGAKGGQNRSPEQDSGKDRSNRPAAHKQGANPSGQGRRTHQSYGGQSRPTYAALDLGTNNCRLLVAEPHGQSFRVVDAFSRIVRLGEGLSQSGRLSDDAQDRAISALKVCQSKLAYRSVKRFRLIATEACRRAANGGSFLHRVHKETGLKLEIVNRETEARLAVAGCASLVHPEADGVVLFDIGGGSSEIVWLDLDPLADETIPQPGEKRNRQTRRALRHLSEKMRCWTSLQVGVVTLSEKHGGRVVTPEHFETMVNEVREMLHDFEEREALANAIKTKHIHMLGTSGTVTTLAGVHLGLERYDRRQVDGTWLSAHELRSMIARILEMNFEERMNNPCIGHDRADLVLAGCAILEAFHREWPCPRLRVADRGLREGILMEMMIDDGVWNTQGNRKSSGKKRRSRRRGGRGHRGGQGQKQMAQQSEKD